MVMIYNILLSQYHDIDKANVVLSTLIIYIILYISIPDEWNIIVLAVLMSLDVLPPIIGPYIRSIYRRLKRVVLKTLGLSPLKKKTSSRRRMKRVRFSHNNQYYEYPRITHMEHAHAPAPAHENSNWLSPVQTRLPPKSQMPLMGMSNGMGMGMGMGMGNFNSIPNWQLSPLQQLQILAMQQAQKQAQMPPSRGFPSMIDNRHMAIPDESHSDDISINSDISSELSNTEEGFEY